MSSSSVSIAGGSSSASSIVASRPRAWNSSTPARSSTLGCAGSLPASRSAVSIRASRSPRVVRDDLASAPWNLHWPSGVGPRGDCEGLLGYRHRTAPPVAPEWRQVDVGAWLRGLGLERYEQAFRDKDIDAGVLPDLTETDLIRVGINSVGHRRRLLAALAALRPSSRTRGGRRGGASAGHRPVLGSRRLDRSLLRS